MAVNYDEIANDQARLERTLAGNEKRLAQSVGRLDGDVQAFIRRKSRDDQIGSIGQIQSIGRGGIARRREKIGLNRGMDYRGVQAVDALDALGDSAGDGPVLPTTTRRPAVPAAQARSQKIEQARADRGTPLRISFGLIVKIAHWAEAVSQVASPGWGDDPVGDAMAGREHKVGPAPDP